MPFPFFALGPSLTVAGWMRERHQSRRKVKLTVHRANEVTGYTPSRQPILGRENFYVTVTNASRDREVVVTHVWLDTKPSVHVHDPGLPVRLRHSAPWETVIPLTDVPADAAEMVPWLGRCQLSPDNKIVKSRPRENVPPFGTVPRG